VSESNSASVWKTKPKRAGIARAIVARPEVLLADDPMAGLDPDTARQVCAVLDAVSRELTLVVASAEPLPDLPFPRWLVLDAGKLAHDGPPAPALLDQIGADLPERSEP
jgi:ABC-type multidrug transport system ATPase subunit